MNKQIFSVIQIILAIALILLILLQAKGTGLGSTFGGEFGFYRTKRGFEKMLFIFTVIITILFFIIALIGLLL